MSYTVRLDPAPSTPPEVRRARPHCYDCDWIDSQIDVTGDPAYLDLLLSHINARHVRPLP